MIRVLVIYLFFVNSAQLDVFWIGGLLFVSAFAEKIFFTVEWSRPQVYCGACKGILVSAGVSAENKGVVEPRGDHRTIQKKKGDEKAQGGGNSFTTKDAKKVRRGGRLIKRCANIGRALWQPGRR